MRVRVRVGGDMLFVVDWLRSRNKWVGDQGVRRASTGVGTIVGSESMLEGEKILGDGVTVPLEV